MGTELGIKSSRFTIDDAPTFLFGISYYGALGAPREYVLKDLEDMQRYGFNWIRVWATWAAFENNVSAVEGDGSMRQPYFDRLAWLIKECDRRGMVVDVTLSRGEGVINAGEMQTIEAHRQAVSLLATKLKGLRNWYLDMANENNIPGRGKISKTLSFEELARLQKIVKKIDSKRLVTVSYTNDATEPDLRYYLQDVGVDFLSPHRRRQRGSAEQTVEVTRQCLALMKKIGRVVPINYQEPFRRDFSVGRFQPKVEDFTTDLRGAIEGGAAAWCLHNGDNRSTADQQPRRSFDMREKRLFDQLDEQERKALKALSAVVVKTSVTGFAVPK